MNVTVAEQENAPDLSIFKLTEGFVLWYGGGISVALTSAEELSKRVLEVAKQLEGTIEPIPDPPHPPTMASVAPSKALRESTAIPTTAIGPGVGMTLEQEWANVEKLIAFFVAGFDSNGKLFTRREWDAAIPMFAPHVDPQEAEARLGEFLAELHDD